jgi:hypothetical protein
LKWQRDTAVFNDDRPAAAAGVTAAIPIN